MRFYGKFRGQKFLKLLENWREIWECYFVLLKRGRGGLITEQLRFTNFENKNGWHPS